MRPGVTLEGSGNRIYNRIQNQNKGSMHMQLLLYDKCDFIDQ